MLAGGRLGCPAGATGGRVESHWAWWTMVGILIGWPVLALIIALH